MIKQRFKKGITAILLVFLFIAAFNYELLSYGWMQLTGQLKIMREAMPIEHYLEDPNFPDSLKSKIRLIQEVKKYAVDSLELNESENYTTLYDQKGKPILWNVSACKPYAFEDKRWGFPIIGSFSYKGFFEYDRAVALGEELEKKGWDVRIRTVGGWSTLGWFKDPILSNMLRRSNGSVAELIIHELTHATLFVKNDVALNENLATFIGELGARYFLEQKYGSSSEEIEKYEKQESDYLIFSEYMLTSANHLDSLYQSISDKDLAEKKKIKEAAIRKIVDQIDCIGLAFPGRYQNLFKQKMPNNAYFSSYRRYRAKQEKFKREFEKEFDSNYTEYMSYLKTKFGR